MGPSRERKNLFQYFSLKRNDSYINVIQVFQLCREDPLYIMKVALLRENGLPAVKTFKLARLELPVEAIRYLRILSLTEQEIQEIRPIETGNEYRYDGLFDTIVSIRNELRAIELLKETAVSFLDQQPTSLEGDEQLLKACSSGSISAGDVTPDDQGLGEAMVSLQLFGEADSRIPRSSPVKIDAWNYRCALIYRLTRKNIAHQTIIKLSSIQELLEQIEETASRLESQSVLLEVSYYHFSFCCRIPRTNSTIILNFAPSEADGIS